MSRVTSHLRLHSALFGLSCLVFCVAATAQGAQPNAPKAKSAPVAGSTSPPTETAPGTTATPPGGTAPTFPVTGDPWANGPGQATPPPPVAGPGATPPPPVYFVENVPAPAPNTDGATAPPNSPPPKAAPSPMRLAIDEPLPPPVTRHSAPRRAFWLGARVGWWVPFGDLWGACDAAGNSCDAMNFGSVASSGPMMELDVGARLGRNYNVYGMWERAQLGKGSGIDGFSQIRAETDFIAVGVRMSADPDDVGMVLDLAIGARRFRAIYEGKNELQLSQAPLESRLGIGVDIRMSPTFSLSPMITLGLGGFGKAEWVTKNKVSDAIPEGNDTLTHGWVTLQLGGHFDIGGSD